MAILTFGFLHGIGAVQFDRRDQDNVMEPSTISQMYMVVAAPVEAVERVVAPVAAQVPDVIRKTKWRLRGESFRIDPED